VLKNRHVPELSEANCNATLSRLTELLTKYSSSDVSIILLLMKTLIVVTLGTDRITDWMHLEERRRDDACAHD